MLPSAHDGDTAVIRTPNGWSDPRAAKTHTKTPKSREVDASRMTKPAACFYNPLAAQTLGKRYNFKDFAHFIGNLNRPVAAI